MATAWGAHSELFRPGVGDKVIRLSMTLREAVDAFLLLPEVEQRRCSITLLDRAGTGLDRASRSTPGILMFHAIHRIASASDAEAGRA